MLSLRSLSAGLLVVTSAALSGCGKDSTGPIDLPPVGGVAAAVSATSNRITWGRVSNATSYVVQRAIGSSTTFATVSGANLTDTTFVDTGLEPSATYGYRVQAIRASGPSQYSAIISVTTRPAGTASSTISPPQSPG